MKRFQFPEFQREEAFVLEGNLYEAKEEVNKRLRDNGERVVSWDGNVATIEPLFMGVMDPIAPEELVEEGRRALTANLYINGHFYNNGVCGFLPVEVTQEQFDNADQRQHALWGWESFSALGVQPIDWTDNHAICSLRQIR